MRGNALKNYMFTSRDLDATADKGSQDANLKAHACVYNSNMNPAKVEIPVEQHHVQKDDCNHHGAFILTQDQFRAQGSMQELKVQRQEQERMAEKAHSQQLQAHLQQLQSQLQIERESKNQAVFQRNWYQKKCMKLELQMQRMCASRDSHPPKTHALPNTSSGENPPYQLFRDSSSECNKENNPQNKLPTPEKQVIKRAGYRDETQLRESLQTTCCSDTETVNENPDIEELVQQRDQALRSEENSQRQVRMLQEQLGKARADHDRTEHALEEERVEKEIRTSQMNKISCQLEQYELELDALNQQIKGRRRSSTDQTKEVAQLEATIRSQKKLIWDLESQLRNERSTMALLSPKEVGRLLKVRDDSLSAQNIALHAELCMLKSQMEEPEQQDLPIRRPAASLSYSLAE